MKSAYLKFLSPFSLDLRSLALARIFLGLFILKESIEMIPYVEMFYTKEGFLPRNTFLADFAHEWTYSLFFLTDSPFFVYCLYAIFILISITFILGFKTKLSSILMWVFVLSLHNRNWAGLNGGDDLVRCVLLIFMFLPLNRRFSIDSALSTNKLDTKEITSFWGFAFFFQLAIMYISSAYFKSSPIWDTHYTAMEFALSLEAFSRPAGHFLLQFPKLLAVLTFIVFWAEKFLCWCIFLC